MTGFDLFTGLSNKKLDECYQTIRELLVPYFTDNHLIVCRPEKHIFSVYKCDRDFTYDFIDGAVSMFNKMAGFNWVSFDIEEDDDGVFITLEAN